QHITGIAYFRYLDLEVGPGVFVPRPETEVMTGWAIDRLTEMDVAEPVAADLGSGSGAIALAIAQEVPRARVHAVEGDPLAGAGTRWGVTRGRGGGPRVTPNAAPPPGRPGPGGSPCTRGISSPRSPSLTARSPW